MRDVVSSIINSTLYLAEEIKGSDTMNDGLA